MFFSKLRLKKAVKEVIEEAIKSGEDNVLKVVKLNTEISTLKEQVEDLKLKKKIEIQDIEHMVKIEREKNSLDMQKKELQIKGEYKDKEMKLQSEYYDKSIKLIQEGHENMKTMYSEIMKRLPNVNMSIKQGGE